MSRWALVAYLDIGYRIKPLILSNKIMGVESTPQSPYESMDFDELLKDPVARPIVEQKALEYLKSEDSEYFNREFSGELDNEGYLFKKDGTTSNTKPSQNIGGGLAMEKVMEMVKAELNK